MSAYTAISAISETLQTLSEEHITDTSDLAGVTIDSASSPEIGQRKRASGKFFVVVSRRA